MSVRGPWRALLGAVWTMLLIAPHVLTFAQLARTSSVSCACASRACCCAPRQGATRRAACHGGGGATRDPAAPRWRCNHASSPVWITTEPALLADPVSQPWTPPAPRPFVDSAAGAFDGFPRLETRPPRLLHA